MEYIEQLKHKLSSNNLNATSIDLYIKNIKRLNNNQDFNNLNFLFDIEKINNFINKYKKNTQRTYLISIVSCLNVVKDKNKKFKILYDKYYNMMKELSININNIPTDILNDTQKKGFISYDELLEEFDKLHDYVLDELINEDKLNKEQYNKLLTFVILSLYILQNGPRRNIDYQKMNIMFNNDNKKKYDDKYNWYDLKNKVFIFNQYKTKKVYGTQIIDVNPKLSKILQVYFGYHPLLKFKNIDDDDIPLLVKYDGSILNQVNSITNILNKFRPYLGSSMLRHIVITDKFKNVEEEKKKLANEMGHSVSTQNKYIKNE